MINATTAIKTKDRALPAGITIMPTGKRKHVSALITPRFPSNTDSHPSCGVIAPLLSIIIYKYNKILRGRLKNV